MRLLHGRGPTGGHGAAADGVVEGIVEARKVYSPECVEGKFSELRRYEERRDAAQEKGREVSPGPRRLVLKGSP